MLHSKSSIRHQPSFTSKEVGANLGYAPIVVFPLQNATGKPELNWLSIALQESLTEDLYCISELHTKALLDFNAVIKKCCPSMTLSCVGGMKAEVDDPSSPLKFSDWQDIATSTKLGQFLWGNYRLSGEEVTVHLRLYSGKKWTSQGEMIIKAPISGLLRESSRQLLLFLETQNIAIKPGERERILFAKTALVGAWKQNAMGYWWQQRYFAVGKERKNATAEKYEAYLKKAVTLDPGYAEAWCNLGYQRVVTGDLDRAVEAFRKALKHKPEMLNAHMGLGYCLAEKGDLIKAISHLEQGIRLNPSLSDYYGYLMNAYRSAKLWQEGIEMLNFLEPFLNERNRKAERMEVIWWQALFLQELKKFAESKKAYQEVLSFKEKTLGPEHPEVATILNNLAFLNKSIGEYDKAQTLYERALAIDEKTYGHDHPQVSKRLSNLALLYHTIGEYDKAQPLYERALAIDEKAYGYEHPEVAKDLSNLAGLYYAIGEYGEAKPLYERALAIDEKAYGYEHPEVAKDFNNLAELYRVLGEYEKAKYFYQRAMDVWSKVHGPDHPNVAIIKNNLAELYCDVGNYDKAKPLYEDALSIYEKVYGPQHPHVATVLNNLGGLHYTLHEYYQAKPFYERALSIDEEIYGDVHPSVSIRLNNLAELYYVMGDYERARPLYERALTVARTSSYPELLWRVQFNLAYLLAQQKNPYAAIFFSKESVDTIQSLRTGIAVMDKDLQKSFLKTKWHVYQFLADLLIDQGRLPEAQQVLDMKKEQEYFDFLLRDASQGDVVLTPTTYTDMEQNWSKRYREISNRIAALGEEFAVLKQKKKHRLSDEETKRYQQVRNGLKIARKSFDSYLTTLIEDLRSATKERYAEVKGKRLDKPRKLQQALRELGHGAVVIHYLITDDKLRIILTTTEVQLARDVSISSKELNHKIMDFRSTLQNPRHSPLSQAQELYRIVLAPIEEDLKQARAKTLMLSLDGALRYLPVAALHDGDRYVVERYPLAVYTPAAGLDIKDKPSEKWQVGGFGLSRAVLNLEPLPHVPEELEAIVRRDRSDPDGVMPGVIFLDKAFSQEALESVLTAKYPVVHIASHFELRPGTHRDSRLVLGNGTTLTLEKIKHDDYDFGGVELLTLSACDTAVEGAGISGSEVESFGTLAQDQGAKGVLATLWPVADKSTGILMQNFYQLRVERPGMTKAEALHLAQLEFISGHIAAHTTQDTIRGMRVSPLDTETEKEVGSLISDSKISYTHPFYWAPFILMGNWL